LCSGVNTGGALKSPAAGPIAIGDTGKPTAINGISVPDMYDAFVSPSIVEMARDARSTGFLICRVINSPQNTVIPTGVKKNVILPNKLPSADVPTSFLVKILNGFGMPFVLSDFFILISLYPDTFIFSRVFLLNSSNSVKAIGPIVIPKKNDTKTSVSLGTMSSPQYKCLSPIINIANGKMLTSDNILFRVISAKKTAPMVKMITAYVAILSAYGNIKKAIKKLAGIDTSVPMTEPDDIFRMLTSGMPCSFNTMACSTIGAAMTPPGMPATATGMESVSFLATMADMKNARMTYGDSPTSASAMVTGAKTAVSSVPGATPIAVYNTAPPTLANII